MLATRRSVVATAGLAVAAVVLGAACGGSSHAAVTTTQTSTTTTVAGRGPGGAFAAQLTAFRACMSSHGVTLATRPRNGNGNGNGTPPSTAPGDTRPRGGFGGGFGGNFADRFAQTPPGQDNTKYQAAYAACKAKLPTGNFDPANNTAFQAYRSCLADHGVTLPANGGAGSINRNDPKVQAALNTCRPLLPAGGPGRGTTTTTVAPA